MNAPATFPTPETRTPDIMLASIQMMSAARHLAMAASRDLQDPGFKGWEYRETIKNLTDVADSLGFDLVKREAQPAPMKAPLFQAIQEMLDAAQYALDPLDDCSAFEHDPRDLKPEPNRAMEAHNALKAAIADLERLMASEVSA